eukprot:1687917-Prymnesium_polylepis.1
MPERGGTTLERAPPPHQGAIGRLAGCAAAAVRCLSGALALAFDVCAWISRGAGAAAPDVVCNVVNLLAILVGDGVAL